MSAYEQMQLLRGRVALMLDSIADRLESRGYVKEAFEIDKVADAVQKDAAGPAMTFPARLEIYSGVAGQAGLSYGITLEVSMPDGTRNAIAIDQPVVLKGLLQILMEEGVVPQKAPGAAEGPARFSVPPTRPATSPGPMYA